MGLGPRLCFAKDSFSGPPLGAGCPQTPALWPAAMAFGLMTPAELEIIRPHSGRLGLRRWVCGAKPTYLGLPSAYCVPGSCSARNSSSELDCGANPATSSTSFFGSQDPLQRASEQDLRSKVLLPTLLRGLRPPRPPDTKASKAGPFGVAFGHFRVTPLGVVGVAPSPTSLRLRLQSVGLSGGVRGTWVPCPLLAYASFGRRDRRSRSPDGLGQSAGLRP